MSKLFLAFCFLFASIVDASILDKKDVLRGAHDIDYQLLFIEQ